MPRCILAPMDCDGCLACHMQPKCSQCGEYLSKDKPWHDYPDICTACREKDLTKVEE